MVKSNFNITVSGVVSTLKKNKKKLLKLRKPSKSNKGKRGQQLEIILGIPNGNSLTDMTDGELKSYTRGESIAVTQLKHCLNEIINKKIAFHNSKVGIKMKQTIYVAFYKKSGTYKDYTVLNKKTHKKHYQHLKEDYEYICNQIVKNYKKKTELHTITGPNNLLQIRTKDSKNKYGLYNPLMFQNWQAKNKNMAFYLTAEFGKQLFQRWV